MSVLVGIDLRASGHEWLVRRAADYAAGLGSPVDLVYMTAHPGGHQEERAQLQALLGHIPEARRGRARVEAMDPVEGLVTLSTEYELLVVGSREPPALERLMRGPMATRVLRAARCPVLVPRGEHGPGRSCRLLVGVDLEGPHPDSLISLAAPWARAVGGKLDALYVDTAGMPRIADRSVREAAEREWRALRAPKIQQLAGLLEAIDEPHRGSPVLEAGNPEDVLSQLSGQYDVVLVGNRDRLGLSRLILGAVGDLVVRRAESDVISLPTNLHA